MSQETNSNKLSAARGPLVVLRVLRFKFLPSVSQAKAQSIMTAFEALRVKIDQIAKFEGGPTLPSQLGTAEYMYIVGFCSKQDLEEYESHPAHLAFVELLKDETGNFLLDGPAGSSVDDVRVEVG